MENKRTCLYDKHVALGALMQPFEVLKCQSNILPSWKSTMR